MLNAVDLSNLFLFVISVSSFYLFSYLLIEDINIESSLKCDR